MRLCARCNWVKFTWQCTLNHTGDKHRQTQPWQPLYPLTPSFTGTYLDVSDLFVRVDADKSYASVLVTAANLHVDVTLQCNRGNVHNLVSDICLQLRECISKIKHSVARMCQQCRGTPSIQAFVGVHALPALQGMEKERPGRERGRQKER